MMNSKSVEIHITLFKLIILKILNNRRTYIKSSLRTIQLVEYIEDDIEEVLFDILNF